MRREIEYLLTMLWFPKMETFRHLCRRRGLRIVLLHRFALHQHVTIFILQS